MRTRGTVCCTTPVAQSNLRTFFKVMTPRRWPELSFLIWSIKGKHCIDSSEHTAGDCDAGGAFAVFSRNPGK
jgi:hypothetical protein